MNGDCNLPNCIDSVPNEIGAQIVSQANVSRDELKKMGQMCHALNRWVWKNFGNQGMYRSMEWHAGPQGLQNALMRSQGLVTLQLTNSGYFAACLEEIRQSTRFETVEHLVLVGKAQELLDAKAVLILRRFTHLKSLTLKNVSFLPQVVVNLPKVRGLHLIDCQVRASSHELFSAIAKQSELRTLEVQGCITSLAERVSYSKEGLLELQALDHLERLYGLIKQEEEEMNLAYRLVDDFPKLRKVTTLPFRQLFADPTTISPNNLPTVIRSLHKAWRNDPEIVNKVARLTDAKGLNLFGHIACEVAKLPPSSELRRTIDTTLRLFPKSLQLFKYADATRQIVDRIMSLDRKTLRFFIRFGSDLKEMNRDQLLIELQDKFQTLPATEKQKAIKMIQLVKNQ